MKRGDGSLFFPEEDRTNGYANLMIIRGEFILRRAGIY